MRLTPRRVVVSGLVLLAALMLWLADGFRPGPGSSLRSSDSERADGSEARSARTPEKEDPSVGAGRFVTPEGTAPAVADRQIWSGVVGSIRDPSGAAVDGAKVTLFRSRDPDNFTRFQEPGLRGQSDAGGRFEIQFWEPATGWLVVDKPGFARLEDHVRLEFGDLVIRNYLLSPAADWLEGIVTEAGTGRLLADVEVFTQVVAPSGASHGVLSLEAVKTSQNGEYRLPNPPLDTTFFLWAGKGGYLPRMQKVRIAPGTDVTTVDVDLELEPGAEHRLKVTTSRQQPIPRAQVSSQQSVMPYYTDSQGEVTITLAGNQDELVRVSAPGYLQERVTLKEPAGIVQVVLEEAPRLHGWVENSEGARLEGATVAVRAGASERGRLAFARTGAEGSFELRLPAAPVRSVRARHPDYLSRSVQPAPEAGDQVVIVLERGAGTVRGSVRLASGEPPRTFKVLLRRTDTDQSPLPTLSRIFGEGGLFEIANLPAGVYDIEVTAPEGLQKAVIESQVLGDGKRAELRFQLATP